MYKLGENMKKKLLITIVVVIVIIISIIGIYLSISKNRTKESNDYDYDYGNDDGNSIIAKSQILGEERLEKEKEVYNIIDKYIENYKVKNYIETNNLKSLTLKDLKEKLNMNITEFENLEYKCDSESTIIDFSHGVNNYSISLYCEDFLLS